MSFKIKIREEGRGETMVPVVWLGATRRNGRSAVEASFLTVWHSCWGPSVPSVCQTTHTRSPPACLARLLQCPPLSLSLSHLHPSSAPNLLSSPCQPRLRLVLSPIVGVQLLPLKEPTGARSLCLCLVCVSHVCVWEREREREIVYVFHDVFVYCVCVCVRGARVSCRTNKRNERHALSADVPNGDRPCLTSRLMRRCTGEGGRGRQVVSVVHGRTVRTDRLYQCSILVLVQ